MPTCITCISMAIETHPPQARCGRDGWFSSQGCKNFLLCGFKEGRERERIFLGRLTRPLSAEFQCYPIRLRPTPPAPAPPPVLTEGPVQMFVLSIFQKQTAQNNEQMGTWENDPWLLTVHKVYKFPGLILTTNKESDEGMGWGCYKL